MNTQSSLRRAVAVAASTVVVALVATGCADGGRARVVDDSNLAQVTDPPTPSETPTSSPTPVSTSFSAERTLDVDAGYQDGSTYHLQLEVGTPMDRGSTSGPSGFPTASSCEVDSERDLLIPARVVARSTTDGFSINMKGSVYLVWPGDTSEYDDVTSPWESVTVEGDNTYTDSSECTGHTDLGTQVTSVIFNDAASDTTRMHEFYVVVHDYFTPEHPNGNRAALSGLALYFRAIDEAGGFVTMTNGQGDGVVDLGDGFVTGHVFALPLRTPSSFRS